MLRRWWQTEPRPWMDFVFIRVRRSSSNKVSPNNKVMDAKEFGEVLKEEQYKSAIFHADHAGCGSVRCTCKETPIDRAYTRYWNLVAAWGLNLMEGKKYWDKYIASRASN